MPTGSRGALTVAVQELLSIVDRDIMLSRHIKRLLRLGSLKKLVERVEFAGFGKMSQISGMDDQIRFDRQCIDLVDGSLARGGYIRVRSFVETI